MIQKLNLVDVEDWVGRCWGVIDGVMEGGDSIEQLCEAWQIQQARLYRTIAKDKELKDGMTLARQIRAQRYADEALELAKPTGTDWSLDNFGRYSANTGQINRDTLRINTLLKLASKYDPDLFGDRVTTAHEVVDKGRIVIGDTTAAAAIIAKARQARLTEAKPEDDTSPPAGTINAHT